MGPRGGQTTYRDQNHRSSNNYRSNNNQEPQEIDNWDPASTQVTSENKNDETWGDCGDWDNEEYTGSLSDTKVFTPSGATQSSAGQDLAAPPGLEQQILNPPSQNDVTQYSTTVVSSTATAAALNNGQYDGLHSSTTAAAQLRQALEMPHVQSASLSAEQSQYFNTLGSQNSTTYSSSVQYPYNDQVVSNQQAPRQQQQQRPRARVPPPSKIPSTAVEMPGDGLNVYLGVQFGELDFGTGTDESYETDKYAPGLDQSAGDDYQSNKGTGVSKGSQSAGLGGLQPSQLIQNSDSISSSAQADLSSGYAQRNSSSTMGTTGGQSALDQLTKPADIYNHASGTTAGGNSYQNMSYSAAQKSSGYQTGYGTNAYNSTQSSNYQQPTNAYGYNQNSYQQSQGTQSGVGQQQTQTTGSSVSAASQSNNNSSG